MKIFPSVPIKKTFFPIIIYLAILTAIIVTGYLSVHYQQDLNEQEIQTQLSSIADLKSSQISAWYHEREANAESSIENQMISAYVTSRNSSVSFHGPPPPLLDWMHAVAERENYRGIVLILPDREILLKQPDNATLSSDSINQFLSKTLQSSTPVSTDLFQDPETNETLMEFWSPIRDTSDGPVVGVLVFQIDPARYLYPLIQTWPTKSATAESLLIRREGDSVLFLNELRHVTNTSLSLKIPISNVNVPAVMAVKGQTGIVHGNDYRGVPVIADIRNINDTPWYLVAKIDQEEIYAPFRSFVLLVITILTLLVVASGLVIWAIWMKREGEYINQQYTRKQNELILADRVRLLMQQANDAIFIFDNQWKIIEANERAIEQYGYHLDELKGLSFGDLRTEKGRATLSDDLVSMSTFDGVIIHTEHHRKDGSVFPVESSIRTVTIHDTTYHQAIIRDFSERKTYEAELEKKNADLYSLNEELSASFEELASQEEELRHQTDELRSEIAERIRIGTYLQESEERFRNLFENMSSGVVIYEAVDRGEDFVIKEFNKGAETIEHISRVNVIGKRVTEVFPGIRTFGLLELLHQAYKTGESIFFPDKFYQDARNPGSWRDNWLYKMPSGEIVAIYNDITNRKQAEEALKNSEYRLSLVLAGTNDGWWDWDLVTDKMFYSPRWWRMLGYEPGDFPENSSLWHQLLHPDDDKHVDRIYKKALRDGKDNYEVEFRLLHKNGYYVPILSRGFITKDTTGKPIRVSGTNTDLTEFKRSQTELKKSEVRFRRLFEAAKDGILIIDNDTKVITQANPFMENLIGYKPGELIGKTIWNIDPIKDILDLLKIFEELQKTSFIRYEDLPLKSMTGEIHEVEFFSNIYDVDHKKVIQYNFRDITERKIAEKALQESEERFRYALETGGFAAWKLDLYSGSISRSPRYDRIFGYENPLSEWTVNSFLEHVIAEDRQDVEKKIKQTLETFQPWDFECRIIRNDGEIKWIWVKGTPETTIQIPKYMFGLIQDITLRKKAEEELQSLYTDLEIRVKERTLELESINNTLKDEILQRKIAETANLQNLSILDATIESTQDGILVIDNAGSILKLNRQFTTMWKIPESISILKEKSSALEFVFRQVKNPEPFIYKIQEIYITADNDDFDVVELHDGRVFEWYSKPQKIGDSVVGRVWSFRDVTKRREMESQIIKSLSEKEILLKEIHHRVKNNMQVISSLLFIQGRKTNDEQAKEILRESQNRIKSIALVHEKIYQSKDLEQIDYNDYLHKITRYLFESYLVDPAALSLEISENTIFLSIEKAVPCSLIINEMISNSIKYAFPNQRKGVISIDFSLRESTYTLIFRDNGVGISEDINFNHTDTLGIELIKGLVKQLNGTITLNLTHGTAYTITFPQ